MVAWYFIDGLYQWKEGLLIDPTKRLNAQKNGLSIFFFYKINTLHVSMLT